MRSVKAVIVDDLEEQALENKRNLERALKAAGCRLTVVESFTDSGDAIEFLDDSRGEIDLVVTDVLWPSTDEESAGNQPDGLEVILFSKRTLANTLVLAISQGDDQYRRLENNCFEAGAHLFRFLEDDLKGDGGAPWRALGKEIADLLEAGAPYPRRSAIYPHEPIVTRRPDGSVFVVHGHDTATQVSVCRFLEQLKLKPIVLAEQPDAGETIIEKLETHGSRAEYALVLLTADDLGRAVDDDELCPRARQNVILELGYFLGTLGRGKVRALYEEGVELPSDVSGWLYTRLDQNWQGRVLKELREADFDVDANDVF